MRFEMPQDEIVQRLVAMANSVKTARDLGDKPRPLTARDEIALREGAAIVALAYNHLSGGAA